MRDDPTVTFSGGGLDRAAGLRGDATGLHLLLGAPESRCIVIWRGKPLMDSVGLASLAPDHPLFAGIEAEPTFLGRAGGVAWFLRDLSAWQPEEGPLPDGQTFLDPTEQRHPRLDAALAFRELRGAMARLSPLDAELAATARALTVWHETHAFCARCGLPSRPVMGGWQRQCGGCGAMHFPRTDPVVIMLVTRGNRVLLGRSPGWPEGMYSLLAGFIEPGETIEAAVRREVAEETGVRVGAVRYLASQPWPFPASLMIGCAGEALSDEIILDPDEIEDALWLTREEMARVAAGDHPAIRPPRRGAIAAFLLSQWLAGVAG